MEELLILLAATVLVFIPVLALTARFALHPIVEAIIRLREGLMGNPVAPGLESRISGMEAELIEMRRLLERLADAHEFQRQLSAPPMDRTLPAVPARVPDRTLPQ